MQKPFRVLALEGFLKSMSPPSLPKTDLSAQMSVQGDRLTQARLKH